MEAKAFGRADSPYLFIMVSPPSERMLGWFYRQLHSVGILKAQCRIVYLLNEAPSGKSNKPLKGQIRAAASRFRRDVERSSPVVVVPMGTECFQAVTGINESIFDARGYLIRRRLFKPLVLEVWKQVGTYVNNSKATGAKKGDPKMKWVKEAWAGPLGDKFTGTVIPCFTLDYIRTSQFAVAPAFTEDMRRVKRAHDRKLVEVGKNFKYIATLDALPEPETLGDLVAVDIETHGIDNEVIDLVSFSDGETTASIDWTEGTRAYMERLFSAPSRMFAVHNSPFDIPRLVSNGVAIPQETIERQVFDTMFAGVQAQPDLHKALGRMASLYIDIEPWKTSSRNKASHWRAMVSSDPRGYSAKDSFYTYWLAKVLIDVLKDLGAWKYFMGRDGHPGPGVMATLPTLTEMSRGGLRINRAYVEKWCPQLERRLHRYYKLWFRMFPNVSPGSNQQVGKLLYKKWGLPVMRNKDDGITVDELSLVKLQAFVRENREDETLPGKWQSDERAVPRTFDLLLRIREYSRLLSTYVQPVLLNGETWVHPSYMPASKDDERGGKKMDNKGTTATGRLASFKPNIQNQPKKARVLYVPDTDKMCFVQADYKSAELFVLAGVSGDKRLLADLQGDMHQVNADRLSAMRGETVSRKVAKNVTYACVPESAKALTRRGWKGPDELIAGEDIMAFDPETGNMDWSPLQAVNRYGDAPLVRLSHGRGWSMTTTPDHRWWGYKNHITRRSQRGEGQKSYFSKAASFATSEIGRNHCIVAAGTYVGGPGLTPKVLPKYDTDWSLAVLQMTAAERGAFLNGVIISDGHQDESGRSQFTQKDHNHREAMTLAAVLHGYRVAVTTRGDDGRWVVHLCAKRHVGGQRLVREDVGNAPVWCPTVKEGYWLMRQGDTFAVTGNSQYLASPSKQSEMILEQEHIYIEPAECQIVADGIWGYYIDASAYKALLVDLCSSKQYITNPFGRTRFFHAGRAPAAVDFIPQSTVADCLWCVLKPVAELARRLKGRIVTTVHDSILCCVPKRNRRKMALGMKRIMEQPFDCVAPGWFIPVSVEVGAPGAPWSELRPLACD